MVPEAPGASEAGKAVTVKLPAKGPSTVTPEISTANDVVTLVSTQVMSTAAGISTGPVSQSIQCGGNASFSIIPTGTTPLHIQWSFDGAPLAGATSSSLSLTNIHLPSHSISVTVTNLYGSATSNATLTVFDTLAPVITLNGANPLYVELGGTFADPGASALDACAGPVPVSVSGSVNLHAVGTNTLTYTASDGNGNTNIVTRRVVVQDTTPPTIVWAFTNLVLAADTNCTAVMPEVTGTNFIEATDLSGTLTFSQVPTNNAVLPLGTNLVVISVQDASGNTAYSTNTIVVQDETPPVIVLEPQSQTNVVGANVSFSVAATACTPVTCQWFFQNKILDGATNFLFALTNLQPADAGSYFAVAASTGGYATSAVASLTVLLTNGVVGSGGVTLTLAGTPGQKYVLETTTNLYPAIWLPMDTNTLGTNGLWQFTDPQAADFQQRFFRLELSQ